MLVHNPNDVEKYLREQEEAYQAIKDLKIFIRAAWQVIEPASPYVHGWHVDAIAEHLMAVTQGQIFDLLINIPPRFAKSSIVSVIWPVWEWLHFPSLKFINSSYAEQLSMRDTLKSRRLIQSRWFQHHYGDRFKLRRDQNQKKRYENDKMGYRIATSVTGSNTGEGGDRIVCFPYNTKIKLRFGELAIGRIVESAMFVKVLSYNKLTRQTELKEILNFFRTETNEIMEITIENSGILKCTPNHLIYTATRQYVKAEDLSTLDSVLKYDRGIVTQCYVLAVKRKVERQKTYNIEVQDNNNYFADNILVHNCFTWDQVILTESGLLPIGFIVENKLQVNVWSYNIETNEKELKPIENWFENPENEIYEIELEDGNFVKCTPDHEFLTKNRGWVRAENLLIEDEIINF